MISSPRHRTMKCIPISRPDAIFSDGVVVNQGMRYDVYKSKMRMAHPPRRGLERRETGSGLRTVVLHGSTGLSLPVYPKSMSIPATHGSIKLQWKLYGSQLRSALACLFGYGSAC